jgi:3-isopropylmalate/(R)-2-methylmalate dehydratase large subunit
VGAPHLAGLAALVWPPRLTAPVCAGVQPHSPDNRDLARNCRDKKIDRVYIGSCTGGKTEDFLAAAQLLHKAGQQVKVPTFLVPATQKVSPLPRPICAMQLLPPLQHSALFTCTCLLAAPASLLLWPLLLAPLVLTAGCVPQVWADVYMLPVPGAGGLTSAQVFEAAGCTTPAAPSCAACLGGPRDTFARMNEPQVREDAS